MTSSAGNIADSSIPDLHDDGGDEEAFRRHLGLEIDGRLRRAPRSWSGARVLQELAGLDPVYAVPALHDASADDRRQPHVSRMADRAMRALGVPAMVPARLDALPTEHALDFDWRFTHESRGDLIQRLRTAGGRILLLGCPSVAVDARLREVTTTLYDDNPALSHDHFPPLTTYIRADLLSDPHVTVGHDADAALLDPPFYREQVLAFLHAAQSGLRLGGTALVVLPSAWARPSAAVDVQNVVSAAHALGFIEIGREPDRVRYQSPKFEQATFRRRGWSGIPTDWRTAQLLTFRLQNRRSAPTGFTTDRGEWAEVAVGHSRWRVRTPAATVKAVGHEDLTDLLGDGKTISTVSRRDRGRDGANVITDENVAYGSPNPAALLCALRSLAAGRDPVAGLERLAGRKLDVREREHLSQLASLVR